MNAELVRHVDTEALGAHVLEKAKHHILKSPSLLIIRFYSQCELGSCYVLKSTEVKQDELGTCWCNHPFKWVYFPTECSTSFFFFFLFLVFKRSQIIDGAKTAVCFQAFLEITTAQLSAEISPCERQGSRSQLFWEQAWEVLAQEKIKEVTIHLLFNMPLVFGLVRWENKVLWTGDPQYH